MKQKSIIRKDGRVSYAREMFILSILQETVYVRMVEKGLDSEVSNFDIRHFATTTPVLRYYSRSAPSKRWSKFWSILPRKAAPNIKLTRIVACFKIPGVVI